MALAEELDKLDTLRQRGVLSEAEFAQAKARLLAGEALPEAPALQAVNRLRRSVHERWLAGVCGGLAAQTGAEPWLWRLAFVLLFLFAGTGVLLYLLLWIFVPQAEAGTLSAQPPSRAR